MLRPIRLSECACAALIDHKATHVAPLQPLLSGATAAAELCLHSSCAAIAAPPPSASNIPTYVCIYLHVYIRCFDVVVVRIVIRYASQRAADLRDFAVIGAMGLADTSLLYIYTIGLLVVVDTR